jgi:hypothetical protein
MEKRIAKIEDELANNFDDYEQILKLTHELEALKTELEEKEMRWLELSE